MKIKSIYISAILLLSGVLFSCSDFLDEDMKGAYNAATFYKNEANAIRGVNGVYNTISFTKSQNQIWVFGDVASDDSRKGGRPGDLSGGEEIDNHLAKPDNGIIATYWQFVYESISRANDAIYYVPTIDMNVDLRSRLVGEAKFIRAYSYFNLVNIWGQVPLRLNPTTMANTNVPLSDVATIYGQIEKDLNDALSSPIPDKYSSKDDQGRVTRGAVLGMLAKVYLYQQKYAECITAIESLEKLKIYDLDVYENLFKKNGASSVESVFAINHLSDQNPGLGNILNVYFAPTIEQGYYFNNPTDSYVAAFDEQTIDQKDDPRLDASIGRQGKPWLNGDVFQAGWSTTGYLVKKHNQPLAEVEIGKKSDGNLPYIYLRYADILLMKAEALNERNGNNDFDNALVALNRVRHRANLADANVANQPNLREAIRKERRRELGFEFHRFFDLMRWGKDAAITALGNDFPWKEPRYYYPLPQSEKDGNTAID